MATTLCRTFSRLTGLALAVALVVPVAAQQALDRSKIPPPGKTPELHVPTWTRATLANGAEIIVSEKHDLPLVSFSLAFLGGASQYEPADKKGLAGLVASMMSEGTKTRDGEALSNAMQLFGTTIAVGVGGETGSIQFQCTSSKFALQCSRPWPTPWPRSEIVLRMPSPNCAKSHTRPSWSPSL